MKNPISLVCGKAYPIPTPAHEGAAAQFLTKDGNVLQICLPNITKSEERVYRFNPVRAGVLVEGPVILLLFDYGSGNILDCPFDANAIRRESLALPSIENENQRLLVESHIIDTASGILHGLRAFTLAPETTREFLCAVQDQIAAGPNPVGFDLELRRIYSKSNEQIVKQTPMLACGCD